MMKQTSLVPPAPIFRSCEPRRKPACRSPGHGPRRTEKSMAAELRLIAIYLAVSDACRRIVGNGRLRRRGFAPALTDAEVITMEIFAEMQGHHSDSAIWRYYNDHWRHYFPNLPSRSVFAKQCANLIILKQMIQRLLYPADDHITDGFPIVVCRNCRVPGCKIFRGAHEAAWGYQEGILFRLPRPCRNQSAG